MLLESWWVCYSVLSWKVIVHRKVWRIQRSLHANTVWREIHLKIVFTSFESCYSKEKCKLFSWQFISVFFANILKFALRRKLTISECQNSRFASMGRPPAHMASDPARESKLENDAERWKFLVAITCTGRSEESSESESLKSDIVNQILKSTDEWNIWICGVSISSCWAMDHA